MPYTPNHALVRADTDVLGRPQVLPVEDRRSCDLPEVVLGRYRAWLTRLAATGELQVLEARRRVAEARNLTEEAESELELRRVVRTAPLEQGRQILAAEAEIEQLLLERERAKRQRLQSQVGGVVTPLPSAASVPALPSGVEWHLSDPQIEQLAMRAVTRFSALPIHEAERAWAGWRQELGLRLPPYAAVEVARRAEELRRLSR